MRDEAEIELLSIPLRFGFLPVLIHAGEMSNSTDTADYFAQTIDLGLLFS